MGPVIAATTASEAGRYMDVGIQYRAKQKGRASKARRTQQSQLGDREDTHMQTVMGLTTYIAVDRGQEKGEDTL